MLKKLKITIGNIAETSMPSAMDAQERLAAVAFYKAEARGFAPGSELKELLLAEVRVTSSETGR